MAHALWIGETFHPYGISPRGFIPRDIRAWWLNGKSVPHFALEWIVRWSDLFCIPVLNRCKSLIDAFLLLRSLSGRSSHCLKDSLSLCQYRQSLHSSLAQKNIDQEDSSLIFTFVTEHQNTRAKQIHIVLTASGSDWNQWTGSVLLLNEQRFIMINENKGKYGLIMELLIAK